jgi:hypothetical protein
VRYPPISSELFATNRLRLSVLLPRKALAPVNTNDVPVTNADGTTC